MSTSIRQSLSQSNRIVIKVGTSTIMYPNGSINLQRLEKLAFVLSDLKNQGKQVILVSSGAIGVGLSRMNLTERPVTIPEQQAIAAIGQTELMNLYSQFFYHYGHQVGQVLLTKDVVDFPVSRKNTANTFEQLLIKNVIPIVNENDTVSVEELEHLTRFGDNDTLSAIVLEITDADLLILLSDIDGFYDKNPTAHKDALLFNTIDEITDATYALASDSGSRFGTGGMTTKLNAAQKVLEEKKQMVLANGEDPAILFQILAGEQLGTLFTPAQKGETSL
ncbi:glutamate 5-kinase [Marinilactibacillus psychrotolerans]|uniref:Glutamate 5-kinase n=1 Tax=Marinilactibacillus psychrotolerans TaxID=191770 RepID=A0AAV3WAD7_9LACT|nr:glutamate 5-kinase [Marinilactibacillus psychrotolerans]GEL66409.1 glutamate 5-kinase [Marinilactibacillus psychrotolerans]GEQ36731.1 glutamate 5-kinase [Marinilactibacillus psychrotolerans]SDD16096.1 glutamate 5-kinase [Marinilactibacillus psychrotolerans]